MRVKLGAMLVVVGGLTASLLAGHGVVALPAPSAAQAAGVGQVVSGSFQSANALDYSSGDRQVVAPQRPQQPALVAKADAGR